MPSSAASVAMLRGVWAKVKVSSVMLIWKCLAMWRRHSTDRLADRRGAAQRTARPLHADRDACELLLGDGQQLRAFAGPLFGQQRVLADHQAFARIVGAGDLGHVTVIKQRGLQWPARGRELLDRRRPQCGDPIQTSRAQ